MEKSLRLYLSGKITGDPNYKAKFAAAAAYYEEHGYTVLNPANHPAGLDTADYVRINFAMIDSADVVAFLPDYQLSAGALLEYQYCLYVEKPIKYLSGGELYGFSK